MKITNNSQQPQGVHGINGLVFIQPGQTKDVEMTEGGLAQAKELAFLGIEGVARDLSKAPNSPSPASGGNPLDHDGDGKPGGAAPNDPPSERDELKKQAGELGIEYAKNISTEKLRALIDAKLAE